MRAKHWNGMGVEESKIAAIFTWHSMALTLQKFYETWSTEKSPNKNIFPQTCRQNGVGLSWCIAWSRVHNSYQFFSFAQLLFFPISQRHKAVCAWFYVSLFMFCNMLLLCFICWKIGICVSVKRMVRRLAAPMAFRRVTISKKTENMIQ